MLLKREIELSPASTRPLAGPFPNLRTREIVREISTSILTTVDYASWSPAESKTFALGFVRGALTTLQQVGDDVSACFAADLLDHVNTGGIAAVRRIVEDVTGEGCTPLEEPIQEAAE